MNQDQSLLDKHETVKYGPSVHARDRYVHKYFLPQELKLKIFPVDIQTIFVSLYDNEEFNLWENRIPKILPAFVIHYSDIGLDKRIEEDTVRQVLLALAEYYACCGAKLTPEELRAALNLNAWLYDWEDQLLAQCIQLTQEMEQRIRGGHSWLTDYEIDLEVQYYVRDDDPCSDEENTELWDNDLDIDPSLLCISRCLFYPSITAKDAAKEDYWGLGDRRDHNDSGGGHDNPIYNVPHCLAFHELNDHLGVPMKHMGRIGKIYTDIIIRHQNGIRIDLAGERIASAMDEPRIRQEIELPDNT